MRADIVKIGTRVSVKRETLRQRPNVSPIPFTDGPVISKVVRGDSFDGGAPQRSEILAPAGRKADNPTASRPSSIPLHHPVG